MKHKPRKLLLAGHSVVLAFGFMAILAALPTAAQSQQIWFAPPDNLPRGGHVLGADFPRLFGQPTAWSWTAARVQVFELNPRYTYASAEADLRRALAFVQSHAMALAISLAAVPARGCGFDVEGMTNAAGPAAVARRFRRLGADLRYVVMDEPLFFAHQYTGRNACRYSMAELARAVASSVGQITQYYPNAEFGETEPISPRLPVNWRADLRRWIDDFRTATGRRLVFEQADVDWHGPWRRMIGQLRPILARRGVAFGVIFNASGPQPSDRAWTSTAKRNILAYQETFVTWPDQVIFASWTLHPSRLLPETSPTTLTGLIKWFLTRR